MKYVFISDFFEEIGGAEMVDANIRTLLGGEQVLIRAIDCTVQKLAKLVNCRFIISNFTQMAEDCRDYISKNCEYIKFEHDHQYLKSRNPSIFPDFKAPPEQLINLTFYHNAISVVCQTKQHMDVIQKNTGLKNLVNFGGSVWTDDQLIQLQKLFYSRNPDETGLAPRVYGILDSDIVHKGTKTSIDYCKKNGLTYKLFPLKEWEEFVKDLSECDALVFFAGVLETCSRMAVEARMLGLKVVANNLVSAIHEDWFKANKGVNLVNHFLEKNRTIKDFIEQCFQKKEVEKKKDPEITVILNLYKRPQNLQAQIDAFRNQTVKPKEIWVWQNQASSPSIGSHNDYFTGVNYISLISQPFNGVDKWITSNSNWGVFGRFTMAQMAQTEFVCVNDDDTIPGPRWLETCLESYSKNPGLQGGIGVVLTSDNYRNHYRIGWAEPRPTTEEVDLVGHSWFFPKSYLKFIWAEEPYTWRMEDAHFSYCLQKYAGIKTFVPPQIEKDRSSSVLGYELGVDNVAMSNPQNHGQFYFERDNAIKHYIDNGWKKVLK